MIVKVEIERFYGSDKVGEFETNNTDTEEIINDFYDFICGKYPSCDFSTLNEQHYENCICLKVSCDDENYAEEYFYLNY